MTISKRMIPRMFLVSILIIFSAIASLLLKETVDSISVPEKSLPIINGSIGYTTPNIVLAGYEWNFLTRIVRLPTTSPPDLRMIITDVTPNTPIVINFSKPPISLKVSRSEGMYNMDFVPEDPNALFTPEIPNIYTYCIEAGFDRGSIIYYFLVQTQEIV